MKPERGAASAAIASLIDMSGLGLLQIVNSEPAHRRCQNHGDRVELVFDTGIVVYAPSDIVATMVFHHEPDYVEEEMDRRPRS